MQENIRIVKYCSHISITILKFTNFQETSSKIMYKFLSTKFQIQIVISSHKTLLKKIW